MGGGSFLISLGSHAGFVGIGIGICNSGWGSGESKGTGKGLSVTGSGRGGGFSCVSGGVGPSFWVGVGSLFVG